MNAAQSQWLADTLIAAAPTEITYTRAGKSPLTFNALVGRVSPERYALADGRAQIEVEPADWLIPSAALDFGDGPTEPLIGDRIECEDRLYEALPRDGEPCWRPDNQYRTMYRVRTVRVNNG